MFACANNNTPIRHSIPPNSELMQAETFYQQKQYHRAEQLFSMAVQKNNRQPHALFRLGNIAYRQLNYTKAIYYFDRVIQIQPNHSKAQYNLAMAHVTLAEKHFKFYTATAPEHTDVSRVSQFLRHLYQFTSNRGGLSQQRQSTPLPSNYRRSHAVSSQNNTMPPNIEKKGWFDRLLAPNDFNQNSQQAYGYNGRAAVNHLDHRPQGFSNNAHSGNKVNHNNIPYQSSGALYMAGQQKSGKSGVILNDMVNELLE